MGSAHTDGGALTIYECPECGSLDLGRTRCDRLPDHDRRRAAVRVFREEHVGPLERAAYRVAWRKGAPQYLRDALDAFPAPDYWED